MVGEEGLSSREKFVREKKIMGERRELGRNKQRGIHCCEPLNSKSKEKFTSALILWLV